jgi:hypothetical protein
MNVVLAVVVLNACVLGVAFYVTYEFNKAVRQSGR